MHSKLIFATFAVAFLLGAADSQPSHSRGQGRSRSRGRGLWRSLGLGRGVWGDKGLSRELQADVKLAERFLRNRGVAEQFWRKFFCSKWINSPWIQEETPFTTERLPEMRKLVGTCSVDVGICPIGSCSNRSLSNLFDCPGDGYICPLTETRTADCGIFGQREYQFVSGCSCCMDEGIKVKGTVRDSKTSELLGSMEILFDKKAVTTTNIDGVFEVHVDSETNSVVVTVRDNTGLYMDAVKFVDIPQDFRGPVEAELFMIKKSTPVEIDSTTETKLSLSSDPLNHAPGNAFVTINPDSFKAADGLAYSGPVKASVTFIDTNAMAEELIPGRFLTLVGRNSQENLISDGIFAFDFKDTQGNELVVESLKVTVRNGMQLWDLNPTTGLWEKVEVLSGRKRRQVTLTEDFLIRVQNGRWYNIDKIPGAPRCYFKARIYNQTSGEEILNSQTSAFRPEIMAFTSQNQRLRLYADATYEPSETCFEVRCPVVGDPNDAMTGFINMTSLESVLIGNAFLPSTTHLKPKQLDQYDGIHKTMLEAVQYTVAPNGLDIFLNFVSSTDGPLYTDLGTCEKSTTENPSFDFYKAEPPSYEPVPAGNEICTARIAFKNDWNFYSYISSLETMPNVTGISTWQQNGQSYYYTDTAVLENSTIGEQEFVFACLQYRCSPNDTRDESVTATTVYLDIGIRNITYNYTFSDVNGTLVTRNASMPEFFCYGFCQGELCQYQGINANGTSIDGGFIAPISVGNGPDFFDSTARDCKSRPSTEPFAYEFYCHSNDEIGRGSDGVTDSWQPM